MKHLRKLFGMLILLMSFSTLGLAQTPLAPSDLDGEYQAGINTANLDWKARGQFRVSCDVEVPSVSYSPTMNEIFNNWVRVGSGNWNYNSVNDQLYQTIHSQYWTFYYSPEHVNVRDFYYEQYMGVFSGGDDDYIGFIFRVQPGTDDEHASFYLFTWGGGGSHTTLDGQKFGRRVMKIVDKNIYDYPHGWDPGFYFMDRDPEGLTLWEETTHTPWSLNTWYKVGIEAVGNHFTIWVDDVLLADFEDPDDTFPQGSFGLWTYSQHYEYYKEVSYRIDSVLQQDVAMTDVFDTPGVGNDGWYQILENPVGTYLEGDVIDWCNDKGYDYGDVIPYYKVSFMGEDTNCFDSIVSIDGTTDDPSNPLGKLYAQFIDGSMLFNVERLDLDPTTYTGITDLSYEDSAIPNCQPPETEFGYRISADYASGGDTSDFTNILTMETENEQPRFDPAPPSNYTLVGGFPATIELASYIVDVNTTDTVWISVEKDPDELNPASDEGVAYELCRIGDGTPENPTDPGCNELTSDAYFKVTNTALTLKYPRDYTKTDSIRITLTDCTYDTTGKNSHLIVINVDNENPMVMLSSNHKPFKDIEDDAILPIFYFSVVSGENKAFHVDEVTFTVDTTFNGNETGLGELTLYWDKDKDGTVSTGDEDVATASFASDDAPITFTLTSAVDIPASTLSAESADFLVVADITIEDFLLASASSIDGSSTTFDERVFNIHLAWLLPLLLLLLIIGFIAIRRKHFGISAMALFIVIGAFSIYFAGCFQGEPFPTEWSVEIPTTPTNNIEEEEGPQPTYTTTTTTTIAPPPPPPQKITKQVRLIMKTCETGVCSFRGRAGSDIDPWNGLPAEDLSGTKVTAEKFLTIED